MGRPLHKKYFGNRNIGINGAQITGNNSNNQNYADDRIGGESLTTYTLAAELGSLVINSTYPQPALVIAPPTFPGGVQATATVVWEVESVTVTNGLAGNGYVTTTGGATALTGLGGGTTFNITAVGSGQGEVQTIVPANRGDFTTVPTAVVTYQIQGGDGNNQAEVKFRVKSITTVEKGSGYGPTVDLSWGLTSYSGTPPGNPTVGLTTDSGAVGSATNQENAIIIHARLDVEGSVKNGDIIRQVASRRYKVKTNDGIAVCKLVDNDSPNLNEAYIKATDANGNTYFVTKLTAHRVRLTQWTNNEADWIFGNGATAPWTFDSTANGHVIVENA